MAKRVFHFRYRSAAHWLDVFKTYYGPLHRAFASLDEAKRGALQADILALLDGFNRAGDGVLIVPGEYLEAVITTR